MTKYVQRGHVNGHPDVEFLGKVGGHVVTRTLNDIMEFGHVVRVNADGSIEDERPGTNNSPELTNGEIDQPLGEEWSLFTHHTGQQGGGQIMHDSESIGGRLADDILSTPGLYVAIVCTWLNTGCAACGQEVDYCQGHGPIGDPAGHAIIEQHENDDHSECRECADCQDSVVEGWAVATIPDELQAFNDPRVKCCGRDAADCDCEKPDES